MSEMFAPTRIEPAVQDVLRDELGHCDALVGTITPVLRHLLVNDDHALFSEEVVARMRGMLDHLAQQLLDALEDAETSKPQHEHDALSVAAVSAALTRGPGILAHLHALALEFSLTERLQTRLALDPVLPPLVQALIASNDNATAASGMALLAAQARHIQAQRRMQLPLVELPADYFAAALAALGASEADPAVQAKAEATLRAEYDEGRSRLGLINRLVLTMGGGATAALSVTHAGVALFLSALALGSGLDRDLAVLSTNEAQLARMALALRAAGLRPDAVEEQFLAIHPDVSLPTGFETLGADTAAALLAQSQVVAGS